MPAATTSHVGCNQPLFTKVYVEYDQTLRPEHPQPFELLFDPEILARALTWAKTDKDGVQKCSEAQTPRRFFIC